MDLQFGPYRLKVEERQLLGPEGAVDLSARAFDILAHLLAKPDEVVAKSDLMDAVWPGLTVEENTLQVHISALRKALADSMITTVHGRGYKYAGPRPVAARAAGGVAPGGRDGSGPALPPKPSIAVLPFENMSGDPDQSYFSDGITEDIIAEIGKFKEFLVIARNSSFQLRGATRDLGETAKQLDVQYIVNGSVRKVGNRVRVSVQLTDALESAHLWGEHYDRDLTDVFAIQDEITQMIATRLARQTRTAIAARATNRPTQNMTAYDLYLRALPHLSSYSTFEEAEPFLRRAIALDPDFAAAHAMLGFLQSVKFCLLVYDASLLHVGLDLAATALQLDPDEAYGHLATGFACIYLRRFRQAETSLNRALALNPNDPFILTIRGLLHNYTARPEAGLADIAEAQRRDPFAVEWYDDFRGIILTSAGRFREAIDCYEGIENLSPWSLGYLTLCYAELGEHARAKDCLARFKSCRPEQDLDQTITNELDFFEDPEVIRRYRAILRRLDTGT